MSKTVTHSVGQVTLVATGVVLFLFLVYFLWNLGKSISYNLFYENMVEETVCELVKPEQLTSKGRDACL